MALEVKCKFDPPHVHTYPDDWHWDGPYLNDPRGDPRWKPSVYIYLNASLREVWRTVTPICDDEALDDFSRWGKDGAVYLQVIRPGEKIAMMPYQYDRDTDTVHPWEI